MAPRDIAPGTSFPAAIRAAITSSGAVVLMLTESSNSSPHVLSEIELAFNERKPILPVLVAGVVPTENLRYFISTSQWFDAEGEFDDSDIERLRAHLQKLLAGERIHIDHPAPRTRLLWSAAAALLLVVIAATAYLMRPRPASSSAPPEETRRADSTVETKPNGAPPPAETRATSRVNPGDGQTYVWIPPGRYSMGCSAGDSRCEPDEMPAHLVRIDGGFWLGRTEVTVAQYAATKGEVRFEEHQKQKDAPIIGVTWQEARNYCAAVGGRLPSEAEWEYAARAGTTTSFYDTIGSIAWYEENSDERTHPVGGKTPNAFGLFDMLGNAYEWVLDRYYNEYDESDEGPIEEPLFPNASGVARGGAWTSGAKDVRVSNRLALPPDATEPNVGFRCAITEK